MSEHPDESELLRYIDGTLSVKRCRQINAILDGDPLVMEKVELLKRALRMEDDFRDAMRDSPYVEAERAAGESLVESATSLIESTKKQGD